MIISMCAAAGIIECRDVVISDVLDGIKSGCWRESVGRVRKAHASAYETAVKEINPDPYKVAKDAVNSLKRGFRELPLRSEPPRWTQFALMCQLLCSASASLPGSLWKSARVFCRRISTT
jgi:hypothetical protein